MISSPTRCCRGHRDHTGGIGDAQHRFRAAVVRDFLSQGVPRGLLRLASGALGLDSRLRGNDGLKAAHRQFEPWLDAAERTD